MRCKDTYSRVETVHFPNAVVRVHIPDLTPEERKRREDQVRKAAIALLLEAEKLKRKETGA